MKKIKKLLPVVLFAAAVFMVSCEKEESYLNKCDKSELLMQFKDGNFTEYINAMISDVENLQSEGYLNQGNANALISKLNAALKSLEKERITSANGQFNALINQIEAFINEGILSYEQGQTIINDALQAISGDFSMWECGDPIPDDRDGNAYNTVKIGNQCWMAENLAYLPEVSLLNDPSNSIPRYYVYGYGGTDVTTAKNTAWYYNSGALYNWSAALVSCPDGWHLPSDDETKAMEMALGMTQIDADLEGSRDDIVALRMKSTAGWGAGSNGNNESGLDMFPSGNYNPTYKSFHNGNDSEKFWTSTENPLETERSWFRSLGDSRYPGVVRRNYLKGYGFSVRCVKN